MSSTSQALKAGKQRQAGETARENSWMGCNGTGTFFSCSLDSQTLKPRVKLSKITASVMTRTHQAKHVMGYAQG